MHNQVFLLNLFESNDLFLILRHIETQQKLSRIHMGRILFLLLLDHLIPHLHRSIDHADQAEGPKANLNRTIMMVLAVTLHNIPEGTGNVPVG